MYYVCKVYRTGLKPVWTGFRTARDRQGPVSSVPVPGSKIIVINKTGSVPGSSQKGTRTGTGPDFKALRATTIEEASVQGNLLVHDDIYRVQLKLDPHDSSFNN